MDKELTNYLDQRFGQLDRRLEQVDQRFDEVDHRIEQRYEDAKHYFGVIAEELDQKVRLVAEGVASLNEKFERFQDEIRREFRETQAMIRFSHVELQRQIDNLNQRLLVVEDRLGLRPS